MSCARRLATALLLVGVAACTSTHGPTGTRRSAIPAPSATAAALPVAGPVAPSSRALPPVLTIAGVTGTLAATAEADWTLVAFGKAWTTGVGTNSIEVYDAVSGKRLGSVAVPEGPCAAMVADATYLFTATCTQRGVVRINPRTLKEEGFHRVAVPTDGESSIGADRGEVWAIADSDSCAACTVVVLNATTLSARSSYPIPKGASAVRAGLGGVWISYNHENVVVRLDPATGRVGTPIAVAAGPRFLDVGAGSVWVLTQAAGALCQITPAGQLVGCTTVDPAGTDGGDLTVGDGWVWYRGSDALVAQVDPRTGRVVRRIGDPEGSGSASAGSGYLWITAHDRQHVYRVRVAGR